MVLYQAPSWNVISKRCNSLVLFVLPAGAHRNFCTSRLTALSSSNQARPRLFRTSSDAHSCFILSFWFYIPSLFLCISDLQCITLFCFFTQPIATVLQWSLSINTTVSITQYNWQHLTPLMASWPLSVFHRCARIKFILSHASCKKYFRKFPLSIN